VINKHFGGQVAAQPFREDGQVTVSLKTDCPLFAGLSDREKVLLTHGDSVLTNTTAPGFKVIATTQHIVAGILFIRSYVFHNYFV
jgi:GMP synthase-like glutamine amidotransferase